MGFDQLLGNQRVATILTGYLVSDAIPYSIVFSGPRAAGMLDFAMAFARGVNCLEPNEPGHFCGQCNHCTEIDKGIFPDLNVMEPDGVFYKKEQIAELIEDNARNPLKGKRKINILNNAHQMNPSSGNSFLKVLEEPAPYNVFILLTGNLDMLLPTIKSRCQILKFAPLARNEIVTFMKKKGYDDQKAQLMSYLGQANIDSIVDIDYDKFMEKRRSVLVTLQELLTQRGAENPLLDLYKLGRSRQKFIEHFHELINLLCIMMRDILVLQVEENSPHLINVDFKSELTTLCRKIETEKLLYLLRKMEHMLADTRRNLNIKVLTMEFIRSFTENKENKI